MDEVAENCSKVAVISNGSVFACDCPEKLFRRSDELISLGLDIPLTAKISKELKNYGLEINSDCTVSGFSEKVIAVYGGYKNA